MGTSGQEWSERIRIDLEWRKTNVDWRMNNALSLMGPSKKIKDTQKRAQSAYARRVVRGITTMDFLHRSPTIDAEYRATQDIEDDRSNQIEDIMLLVGDRAKVLPTIKQLNAINCWSPIAVAKVGFPLLGMERRITRSEMPMDLSSGEDRLSIYEEVTPETVAALRLDPESVAPLDGGAVVEKAPIPTPMSSMDMPFADVVDPRHFICDRGVTDIKEAYYCGHLFAKPLEQFLADKEYKNKDAVQSHARAATDGQNDIGSAKSYLGGPLMGSFSLPSSKEVVILCEVFVREDPDDPTSRNLVGTIDLLAEVWVKPLRPNMVGCFPFIVIKADDNVPSLWGGASYIEQAYQDIEDAAWAKTEFRRQVKNHGARPRFVHDGYEFDKENLAKLNTPGFDGIILYGGQHREPPPWDAAPGLPPALIQFKIVADEDFIKNTGITSTMQGAGKSNKVATAFRQEDRFADERRNDLKLKLYTAYTDILLIMTFYLQRYMTDKATVRRGAVTIQFERDVVVGIVGYTLDPIDLARENPQEMKMIEIQIIERILSNPVLLAQFNAKELAKRIAQLSNWGQRVLAGPESQQQTAAPQGGQGGAQGGAGGRQGSPGALGAGVDSDGLQGNTESAVQGAMQRR